MIKTYSELMTLKTFDERFRYLKLGGLVGVETLGCNRYIGQEFYRSKTWRDFRNYIIMRDQGCDLGIRDRLIYDDDRIHIHHINPILIEQLATNVDWLLNEENVITTRAETHRAIHYGSEEYLLTSSYTERTKFDTCPWKKGG